jgi:hypothetical protein
MKRLLLLMTLLSVAFAALPPDRLPAAPVEERGSGSKSLDFMTDDFGISFGNSKRVRGLRFNIRDEGVEEVKGLNLTFWKPGENPDAVMKGLQLGIYGPAADELHFLSIGLAIVEAHSLISGIAIGGGEVVCKGTFSGISIGGITNLVGSMNGITIAGFTNVSDGCVNGITAGGLVNVAEGNMTGISLSGLVNVAEGRVSGITIGGLVNVSEGNMAGISLSSLANVAEGRASGITIGGLANVAEGGMRGISIGGLANVSEGGMRGISIGGLANVSSGDMSGISIGGLAVVADEGPISGLTVGGLAVAALDAPISGITASAGSIWGDELSGITIGGIGNVSFDDFEERRIDYAGIRARSARWVTAHGFDIDIEEELMGFAASGIRINASRITGFASSLVVSSGETRGLSIGGVNYSSDLQVGLSIGIVNYTKHLNGLQIGLVNIARNKSKPFQILPILNAHFD